MKTKSYSSLIISVLMMFVLLIQSASMVISAQDWKQGKNVFKWYKGWALTPSSVSVYIDPNFTAAQKAEIQTAIDRWNAEGCVPALSVTTTSPGAINITRNDNLPGGGAQATMHRNSSGEMTRVDIEIDTNGAPGYINQSVTELTTHELGHALGLDHSDNAADSMKPVGTNGTNGSLSENDKKELKQANAIHVASITQDAAELPASAVSPGQSAFISFDLSGYYPPEVLAATTAVVNSFFDPKVFVQSVTLDVPFLAVGLTSNITHPNSALYLMIELIPPAPFEPTSFVGYHYIHTNPVPLVLFECPFTVMQDGETVYVEWIDLCTYPFGDNLRAGLLIDNEVFVKVKPTGTFSLKLEPGFHELQLFVDDYQVNSASHSMIYEVTAPGHVFTLGTGPEFNTPNGAPTPYGTFYKNFRQQYLVRASELSELGMVAGPVSAIGFDVSTLNNCSPMPNYTIKMKHTMVSSLTTSFDNGAYQLMWTHPDFLPAPGWNTHAFATPFIWDGQQNILIDLCFDMIPGDYTQNASVFFTPTPGVNTSLRYQNDNIIACGTGNPGVTSVNRANMQISGTMAACLPPQNLLVTGITPHNAVLGWSPVGNQSSWNVEVGLPGFIPGTGQAIAGIEGININTWTVEGLNENSKYQFFVQGVCTEKILSNWSAPCTFTTPCIAIGLPITESFPNGIFPACWSQTYEGGITSDRWSLSNTTNAGGQAWEMKATDQNKIGVSRLISPPIDLSSVSGVMLEFKHFYDDFGAGCTFRIQTSPDMENWVDEAFSFISGNGNIGPETVSLVINSSSPTTYFAWVIDGDHYKYDKWYIDDVHITGQPLIAFLDFGDAPDPPYPTLLANDGARHIVDGFTYLGLRVDDEPDGQPTANADGDDINGVADDEDGITFEWPLVAGQPCKMKVTANMNDALFNGWVDFDGNGSWADTGEKIFSDLNLPSGSDINPGLFTRYLNFIVPQGATSGNTYSRFRFSHQAGLSFTGLASDGEVEDYKHDITSETSLKWIQYPGAELPGLHAHDKMVAGGTQQIIIADDWICNGGDITGIFWFGNYESIGSGINHFSLAITDHDPNLCLPGNNVLWTANVSLSEADETNTYFVNNAGDSIYMYSYTLPQPFQQWPDNRYWLLITSVSNDPYNPAIWRWQEAARSFVPILCSASERLSTNGIPASWSHISWPVGMSQDFSDMAFGLSAALPVSPVVYHSVSQVYSDPDIEVGDTLNVIGYYMNPDKSFLLESYADYLKNEPLPPNSLIKLTGTQPAEKYFNGGLIIVKGTVQFASETDVYHLADTIVAILDVFEIEYILEGEGPWNDADKSDFNELFDDGFYDFKADCDSCKFAVLISGGINFENNHERYWTSLAALYNHKVTKENYCPHNVFVHYYHGIDSVKNLSGVNASTVRVATEASIKNSFDQIRNRVAACHSQGKKSTLQKLVFNHGAAGGDINLLGTAKLKPDSLKTWQESIIAACCSTVYDEFLQCYAGIGVNKLRNMNNHGKATIYINSSADNDVSWSPGGPSVDRYLEEKLAKLASGASYPASVEGAKRAYDKLLEEYISDNEADIRLLWLDYIAARLTLRFTRANELMDEIKELRKENEELRRGICKSTNITITHMEKYCEWKEYVLPPGGRLVLEFQGSNKNCGNVTIAKGTKSNIIGELNWNVPGSFGYQPSQNIRTIQGDLDKTTTIWVHNDNGKYKMIAEVKVAPDPQQSLFNDSQYAGFARGGTDNSSAEFTTYVQPALFYEGIDITPMSTLNLPAFMGNGFVQEFGFTFTIHPTDIYWSEMELYLNINQVLEPGMLHIFSENIPGYMREVMITTPGEYIVPLGNMLNQGTSGMMQMVVPFEKSMLNFEFDCWGLSSAYTQPADEYDFGDAPDGPYPTLLVNDGARHQVSTNVFLGTLLDAEPDGFPSAVADGDDLNNLDDEDGVSFLWPVAAGIPCKVKVKASTSTAMFNGWIDFNKNGTWADAQDHIFNDYTLQAGDNYLTFITPPNIIPGPMFSRFRYSHDQNLSFTGAASDGEVEDYTIEATEYGDIKWQQLPETICSGLHADATSIIADDWICFGGQVTDIHWWGNYELDDYGVEKKGAGINHFRLNIHNDVSCLPGGVVMSYIVPFNMITEQPTGMMSSDNSPIYKYDFILPQAFLQAAGTTYWLSITAMPNNPGLPAIWRWQEANRGPWPINCGATDFINNQWQTIIWVSTPPPPKFSDLAFVITSTTLPSEYDFGDAPEGSTAYPGLGVTGQFPTCISAGPATWIQHSNFGAFFGPSFDFEPDGNAGLCPLFNPNNYNKDECYNDGDAGLIIPGSFTIIGPVGSESVIPCTGSTSAPLGAVCCWATWGSNIDIQVQNFMPNNSIGYVNMLIDWNQDGIWGGNSYCLNQAVPEHVLINFAVPNPYNGNLSALAPPGFFTGPNAGFVWMRISITETPVAVNWDGSGMFEDGETEDYLLALTPAVDWGDAPDPSYPTLSINNGACHHIDGITYLGSLIDAEADGLPTANADGDDNNNLDDEDGVTFVWQLMPGNPCKIKVNASVGSAFLNAWIDFNRNGSWADAGEQVFIDLNLVAGDNFLTFVVPANSVVGATYARFRFSNQTGLTFTGLAPDGEVEDYKVEIVKFEIGKWIQYYDESLPGLHAHTPDLIADDWICTGGIITDIVWSGNYELNSAGQEKRGAGINNFQIKIYSDNNCLPGTTLLTYNAPFASANESGIDIYNNEGCEIYIYGITLSVPFNQIVGTRYWISIQAIPNNAQNPAIWRWNEANRWYYPIKCGAAQFFPANNTWQTIVWSTTPPKYSDMAFGLATVIADVLLLEDVLVGSGQTKCYQATQTITTAGAGKYFIVQNNATVHLIAGQSISMLQGTHFQSGSMVHAYIDLAGEYCSNPKSVVSLPEELYKPVVRTKPDEKSFFTVYPNPTDGQFTLELNEVTDYSTITVEIFSMLGEKVISLELPLLKQYLFDLSSKQTGLYLIRVMKGDEVGVKKVIKQ